MTTGLVTAIERIDDIPLLLAQMKKMALFKNEWVATVN